MRKKKQPLSVEKFTLCQVHDENDIHYGCMFQVGDVRGVDVHGFIVLPGRGMLFITTLVSNVTPIGKCVNAGKVNCSEEWSAKYGITEEIQAHQEETNVEDRIPRSKEREPVFI